MISSHIDAHPVSCMFVLPCYFGQNAPLFLTEWMRNGARGEREPFWICKKKIWIGMRGVVGAWMNRARWSVPLFSFVFLSQSARACPCSLSLFSSIAKVTNLSNVPLFDCVQPWDQDQIFVEKFLVSPVIAPYHLFSTPFRTPSVCKK